MLIRQTGASSARTTRSHSAAVLAVTLGSIAAADSRCEGRWNFSICAQMVITRARFGCRSASCTISEKNNKPRIRCCRWNLRNAMKQPEKDTKTMETVLVVEDSRPMQRTLQPLLEADSVQAQIASDGISGLETFRKQPPRAVLLDLKLPGMSGKELCREFKTIAASVPIVVLSANAEVEDKVLLLELGADDYVTKPFSPRELLPRVRRAMRRGG